MDEISNTWKEGLNSITSPLDIALTPSLTGLKATASALEQAVTIPDFGNTNLYKEVR